MRDDKITVKTRIFSFSNNVFTEVFHLQKSLKSGHALLEGTEGGSCDLITDSFEHSVKSAAMI